MDKKTLIEGYTKRLRQFGPSAKAVQYSDAASQFARFEILLDIDHEMASVLDVGCGLSDFWRFLRARGNLARYCGVDIVPDFVALSSDAMADDPQAKAQVMDAEASDLPAGYDYAVLSGVFNNKMSDNWAFMAATLRRMWAAADRGIAFNAMSTHVDFQDPDLWYVDPARVLAFCKSDLGGHPVLRHDYITKPGGYPFEFAVHVYRHPVLPGQPHLSESDSELFG
jgi:SAM-dependent methyltransferase